MKKHKLFLLGCIMGLCMLHVATPSIASYAYTEDNIERPGPVRMAADAAIARPLFLAATAVGAALYVITLPLSWAGGNVDEAGKMLVELPARNTFERCLGCTVVKYRPSDHKPLH